MRTTRQRGAILHALEHADRPLSASEVLALARSRVPGLGLATVYRTIDSLVDAGALKPVDIPGKAPRYEVAGKDHHHHFLCKRCHRVFEVHGCPGNIDAHLPRGFTLEGHELTLFGLCAACTSDPSKRASARETANAPAARRSRAKNRAKATKPSSPSRRRRPSE